MNPLNREIQSAGQTDNICDVSSQPTRASHTIRAQEITMTRNNKYNVILTYIPQLTDVGYSTLE